MSQQYVGVTLSKGLHRVTLIGWQYSIVNDGLRPYEAKQLNLAKDYNGSSEQ